MPGGIPWERGYFKKVTIQQLMYHSELAAAGQWDKGNIYLKQPLRIPQFTLYLFKSKSKKAHTHQIYVRIPTRMSLEQSLSVRTSATSPAGNYMALLIKLLYSYKVTKAATCLSFSPMANSNVTWTHSTTSYVPFDSDALPIFSKAKTTGCLVGEWCLSYHKGCLASLWRSELLGRLMLCTAKTSPSV